MYQNAQLIHPIHGNIKCLLAISWIALLLQIHYLYMIAFLNAYYSYLEVIFNVLLTLSLNLIAIFLSVINNLNSKKIYSLFKFSFILSIANFAISILSIAVILCVFNNKLRGLLSTSPYAEALYEPQKIFNGSIVFFIRFIELLPFLIFLCYLKPILNKDKGVINQQLKAQGITDEKYNPLYKEENDV